MEITHWMFNSGDLEELETIVVCKKNKWYYNSFHGKYILKKSIPLSEAVIQMAQRVANMAFLKRCHDNFKSRIY